MNCKTITFYKYTKIENPELLHDQFRSICQELNLLGRIILGEEGINAGVSGIRENIELFKKKIKELFPNLTFREQNVKTNSYHKLVVRVRNEIVAFGEHVDMDKKGEPISPKELKKLLDENQDVILLDARNDYEFKLGKFRNALTLSIKNFREFPNKIKEITHLKNKRIVLYCTGGIRCEKSSALLKQKGFQNVMQLEGGIINYFNQFSNIHFQGSCFVFDDRLTSVMGEPISNCELCNKKCDIYINCNSLDCDKLFVCCEICQKKLNRTCSEECMTAPKQRHSQLVQAN